MYGVLLDELLTGQRLRNGAAKEAKMGTAELMFIELDQGMEQTHCLAK